MVTIIQRSVIRDIVIVLPVSVVCLNVVLMMEKVLKLSRFLAGVGASFGDFLHIMVLIQPQLLFLTLPMSFLLSLLIVYGRMNMDSEIVVMRSVGMSMRQISLPALLIGLAVFVTTVCMTFFVSPVSAKKLRMLMNRTVETRAPLSLEENVFHDELKGITLMIGRKPSPRKMKDIFIYDGTDSGGIRVVTSKKGKIFFNEEGNVFFDMRQGYIHAIKESSFTEITFDRYVFKIDLGMELLSAKINEKFPFELLKDAERMEGKRRMKIYTEFHRRLTLPLMNICLIFLAPALAMTSGRSGKLIGFMYGVAVFSAYYFLLVYVESLIKAGRIHHLFAWIPLVIIGIFSVYLYTREAAK